MPEIKISDRAHALVEGGVIVISIHLSRDGLDMWGRVTQPHERLGIATNQSYPVEDLVDMLEKVKLPVHSKHPEGLPTISYAEKAKPAKWFDMNLSDAQTLNREKQLDKIKRGNIWNQLPSTSLHAYDLERSNPKELMARAVLVAHKVGTHKLLSRIATNDDLQVEDGGDLFSWWARASPLQRWTVLSTSAVRGSPGTAYLKRMGFLPCPFRDTEESLPKESEESLDEDWKIFEE